MKTLSSYLASELKERDPFFYWKILIHSEQHLIEVKAAFEVEHVKSDLKIKDDSGHVAVGRNFMYETSVCFYQPGKSTVLFDRYLYTCPVNSDETVERGYVDAVIKQFILTLNEAREELKNYVSRADDQSFLLVWQENNFETTLKTLKDLNEYSSDLLKFDIKEERPALNQLKGDANDGVDRV